MDEEKTTKTKVKKKRWVQIFAPQLFKNELIGEVPVSELKSLIGRSITVDLMSLTRDMKKQNTKVKFVITNIKGDKANTDYYGYYLNQTSIKRSVRRGKEKMGVSIVCKTADNKRIRVMPLMIPPIKVKGSVAAAFKKNATNYLTSYAAKTTFDNIIKDLITNKLQRDLKDTLKKIYPLRVLEIAKLHIEKEDKPIEKKLEEEVKEEVEEKPKEDVREKVEEKPKEEKVEEIKEDKK